PPRPVAQSGSPEFGCPAACKSRERQHATRDIKTQPHPRSHSSAPRSHAFREECGRRVRFPTPPRPGAVAIPAPVDLEDTAAGGQLHPLLWCKSLEAVNRLASQPPPAPL